ncbi:MAG: TIGR04255 family protein [Ferruginibacter sp.]
MRLPVKITPDSIKDSIVEIKYSSRTPFEVLVGFIYNALDDTYKYTNRPAPNNNQQVGGLPSSIEFQIAPLNIFFTETIKLDIRPNSLIFNCLNGYRGWLTYKSEIEKTLNQISTVKEIEKYNRIGVRYISQYSETDITSCTKFNFSFGMPEVVSDTYVFRTEFNQEYFRIILSLQHKAQMLTGKFINNVAETKPISTIDIDVIAENLSLFTVPELSDFLDKIHDKEKEVFFSIISEDYLKKLNPVY